MRATAAVFATTLLAAPLAAGAYTTEVSPVLSGISQRVYCPEDTAILGGGMDPEDPTALVASVLVPLDPVGLIPASFTVTVLGLADPHDFRAAAICGNLPDHEIVEASFAVPTGGIGVGSVQCPLGKVAVSGGSGLTLGGFAADATVATSAPYFPSQILSPDLTDRAEGQHPAPGGWKAARQSEGPVGTGEVHAVCVSAEDVVTVVQDDAVAADDTKVSYAFCPAGMAALGGGVDAVDRSGLRVASSAPLYIGNPLLTRLFALDEGTAGAPFGWRVALRNDGGSEKPFKVAAICVPEPEAPAAVALAALGLVASRRRRRLGSSQRGPSE